MSRISHLFKYIFAGTAMMMSSLGFAEGAVCYGDLDGICRSPELRVEHTAVISLPGNLFVDGNESRFSIAVLLQNATFAVPPTVIGSADIACSDETSICVVSDGPFAITNLRVSGEFMVGDAITARVKLFNPNASTLIFDQIVTLATIGGVTDVELFAVNPADNPTQQTFIRIANIDSFPANVRLRPIDDTGNVGGEVSLTVMPGAAIQLNSGDLESGNPTKGLSGSFGNGKGKWRVSLIADAKIRAQVFVRSATDGSLSALSNTLQ